MILYCRSYCFCDRYQGSHDAIYMFIILACSLAGRGAIQAFVDYSHDSGLFLGYVTNACLYQAYILEKILWQCRLYQKRMCKATSRLRGSPT